MEGPRICCTKWGLFVFTAVCTARTHTHTQNYGILFPKVTAAVYKCCHSTSSVMRAVLADGSHYRHKSQRSLLPAHVPTVTQMLFCLCEELANCSTDSPYAKRDVPNLTCYIRIVAMFVTVDSQTVCPTYCTDTVMICRRGGGGAAVRKGAQCPTILSAHVCVLSCYVSPLHNLPLQTNINSRCNGGSVFRICTNFQPVRPCWGHLYHTVPTVYQLSPPQYKQPCFLPLHAHTRARARVRQRNHSLWLTSLQACQSAHDFWFVPF
jgi:hypothetical protein